MNSSSKSLGATFQAQDSSASVRVRPVPRFAIIDGRAYTSTFALADQFEVRQVSLVKEVLKSLKLAPILRDQQDFLLLPQLHSDQVDVFAVSELGFVLLGEALKHTRNIDLTVAYIKGFSALARFLLERETLIAQHLAADEPSQMVAEGAESLRKRLDEHSKLAHETVLSQIGAIGMVHLFQPSASGSEGVH